MNYSPSHHHIQSSCKISAATHLKLIRRRKQLWHDGWYSRITFKKSPSFCMTTFGASLSNITALLPQSRDCSYYVSRPILAAPQLQLKKHCSTRTSFALFRDLSHQSRLAKFTCAWSWRICGITPAVTEETKWYEQGIGKLISRFDKCRNWGEWESVGWERSKVVNILATVMDKESKVQ